VARGGPQRIPRPEGARPGSAPPWAAVASAERAIDLAGLAGRLAERGDGRLLGSPDRSRGDSAVLIPLYDLDGEAHVVLTRRASHLRSHRHEVSFPGGRVDTDDASHWHAAVREADEEIALDPTIVRRIGELDRFVTVGSQTLIHPQVAVLEREPDLVPALDEVEHILHVPVSELLLDEVYREELWPIGGVERAITFFELHGDTVWGATAAMLRQLLAIATRSDETIVRP